MSVRLSLTALVVWGGLAAGPAALADEPADLLKLVPGDMNTLAVVNVRAINQSPRAKQENWRATHETEYLAGAIAVPPWVPVVVIAADLHPGALAHGRSLALVPVDNSVNSEALARRENGVVQPMAGRAVALSPRRGYMGVPAAGVLGVSSTLPRQDFARWFRWAQTADRPVMSPYLREAVAAHKDAHVLIATDLADLIDPTAARFALQQAGPASGEAGQDALVRVLAGVRGLVFTAQVGGPTRATVRVEFAVPMAEFVAPFQAVWPKALEASGLDVPELKAAQAKADGKAVVLTAELSDTSLRRVLSLVRAPGDAVTSPDAGPAIRTPKEAAGLAASVRYYRAVNTALDDLATRGGAKGKDYARSAVFFDSYADKIRRLPIQDVDPVLVQYGASVAAKLRAMAGSLRGLKAQLEAFEGYKSTTWSASGGVVWPTRWGPVGVAPNVTVDTNVEELNKRQAEAVAALEPERARIWGVLEADRSAVRREMQEKYKIDFDQYKQ
jgi:hypothetical protein